MSLPPSFELELAQLSYLSPQDRVTKLEEYTGNSYYIPDEFNNDEQFSVVSNDPNGTLFNVHRGSSTFEDWADSDVSLALGNLPQTNRYKRAFKTSAQAALKYGGDRRVVEVGHSLGGALAHHISDMQGHDSVAFNPGSTPLESGRSRKNQHLTFRTDQDIVSKFDKNNVNTIGVKQRNGDVDNILKKNEERKFLRNGTLSRINKIVQTIRGHSLDNFKT